MEIVDQRALQMDGQHPSDSARMHTAANAPDLPRRTSNNAAEHASYNTSYPDMHGQYLYPASSVTSLPAPIMSREDASSWDFAVSDNNASNSLLMPQAAINRINADRRGSHASIASQASYVSSIADSGTYQSLDRTNSDMDVTALAKYFGGATHFDNEGHTHSMQRMDDEIALPLAPGATPPSSVKRPNLSLFTDESTLHSGWNTVTSAQANGNSAVQGPISQAGLSQDGNAMLDSASASASASLSSGMVTGHTTYRSPFLHSSQDTRPELTFSAETEPTEYIQSAASRPQSAYQPDVPNYSAYGNLKQHDTYGTASNFLRPESAIDPFAQSSRLPSLSQVIPDAHRGTYSQGISPISPSGSINAPGLSAVTDYGREAASDSSVVGPAPRSYFDAMLLGAQHLQQQEQFRQPPRHFPQPHHQQQHQGHMQGLYRYQQPQQQQQQLPGAFYPQYGGSARYSEYSARPIDRMDSAYPPATGHPDATDFGPLEANVKQVSKATLHSWARLSSRPQKQEDADAILK